MSKLSEFKINIKITLSALWASVLSCYIYCDYFELYSPNKLQHMLDGNALFGPYDQFVVLGLSSIMLVTSLMICLSILLPANINRILNIIIGFIMTLMVGLTFFIAGHYFYQMYAAVEVILTLLIVWYAWNWPKKANASQNAKQ